jgi:hypothetical protein
MALRDWQTGWQGSLGRRYCYPSTIIDFAGRYLIAAAYQNVVTLANMLRALPVWGV